MKRVNRIAYFALVLLMVISLLNCTMAYSEEAADSFSEENGETSLDEGKEREAGVDEVVTSDPVNISTALESIPDPEIEPEPEANDGGSPQSEEETGLQAEPEADEEEESGPEENDEPQPTETPNEEEEPGETPDPQPAEEVEEEEQPAPSDEPMPDPTVEPGETPDPQPPVEPDEDPSPEEPEDNDGGEESKTHLITYEDAFGAVYEQFEWPEDQPLTELKNTPALDGYRFIEWREQGTGKAYQFGGLVDRALIIKPYYEINQAQAPEKSDGGEAEDGDYRVRVSVRADENLHYGDVVTLSGVLDGFDGVKTAMVWQSNATGSWQDIPGATSLNYTFTVKENNAYCDYRLIVLVDEL